MTPPRPFAAPEGQEVSFVELFFDLVFVFALTQVTGLVALGVTAAAVARATLVFWMVWWAWTQFTWALNPADTRGGLVRVATLAASAAAFVMAVGLDEAFGSGGLWFIIPYVAVRAVGIGIQLLVAAGDAEEWASVRRFAAASVAGIVIALAGGAMAPAARPWVWLAAAVVDVATVGVAGRNTGWALRAAPFAERHGLFVIIALGESLVAAGSAAAARPLTLETMVVAVGVVVLVCLLWWSYFGWIKEALEARLEAADEVARAVLARDAYSLWHFPVVAGVVGIAVGAEAMVAHPTTPLHVGTLVAFGCGLALFVGGTAAAWWRASGHVLTGRLAALAVGLGGLAVVRDAAPVWVLTVAAVAAAAVVAAESEAGRRPSRPALPHRGAGSAAERRAES